MVCALAPSMVTVPVPGVNVPLLVQLPARLRLRLFAFSAPELIERSPLTSSALANCAVAFALLTVKWKIGTALLSSIVCPTGVAALPTRIVPPVMLFAPLPLAITNSPPLTLLLARSSVTVPLVMVNFPVAPMLKLGSELLLLPTVVTTTSPPPIVKPLPVLELTTRILPAKFKTPPLIVASVVAAFMVSSFPEPLPMVIVPLSRTSLPSRSNEPLLPQFDTALA